MTLGGWIAMLLSVGGVTALMGWCIYKVLTTPESTRHLHSQVDITTPDVFDAETDLPSSATETQSQQAPANNEDAPKL